MICIVCDDFTYTKSSREDSTSFGRECWCFFCYHMRLLSSQLIWVRNWIFSVSRAVKGEIMTWWWLSRWWRHNKNKLFPSRYQSVERVSKKILLISPWLARLERSGSEKVKSWTERKYIYAKENLIKFRMFQGCCAKAHLTLRILVSIESI